MYIHHITIDCRPPLLESGFRERLHHTKGRGWGLPLRDDLILQPWARALGYRIEHRNGNWHHAATFDGIGADVWYAERGWQARSHGPYSTYRGGRRVYGNLALSLFTALLREAPLLLEYHHGAPHQDAV